MCRTITDAGKEQSACVACQTPCIDIDAERAYWDAVTQPKQKLLYYGYVGLVVGYFCYYYLYAGNWTYYFSGAWAHQENQLDSLLNPGLYLLGTPLPIPKLVAVPLVLGGFSLGGYFAGQILEHQYRHYLQRTKQRLSPEVIQHRLFTLCTFAVFNFFFIFGGRPLILLLPLFLQFFYEGIIVGLSTLWFYQTWQRNPDRYARESLATRLRRQLSKLQLNVAQFLEGRSLEDLNTDEVYVLAKVVPGFTKEKRHQAYKGVLREALEEGYVDTASSLEVLQQMRAELDISAEEHRQVLEELGVEDPELLDPNQKRSRENLVRLTGYRQALERMLSIQRIEASQAEESIQALLSREPTALQQLGQEYSVTQREEQDILDRLNPTAPLLHRADFLLNQLDTLMERYHALNQPLLQPQGNVLDLLRDAVRQKKRLLVNGLLELIEHLDREPTEATESPALYIARGLEQRAPGVLQDLLAESAQESAQNPADPASWQQRLKLETILLLTQPAEVPAFCSLELPIGAIATHLESLLFEQNPLIQAASLFILHQIDLPRSQEQAQSLLAPSRKATPFVEDIAQTIAKAGPSPLSLAAFPTLEKLLCLYQSDFFNGIRSETLIDLASRATIKPYATNEAITEQGDTCRELLLLMEGSAQVQRSENNANGPPITQDLRPGRVLDELEVLLHTQQAGTIIATAPQTRILAIPVEAFDDLLDRDRDFARRVLEMESRRLQQLIKL